ncbi:DUF2079 domain-containing protein [Kitasatospora sp. NPDC050543]|uniref:DUF2079 domain-containing protein n=1 Tax=Kitasatospora sp. NPDC050543 TaxID=3364054 RepID=UPI0037ADD65B
MSTALRPSAPTASPGSAEPTAARQNAGRRIRLLPPGLALATFLIYAVFSLRRHDLVLTTGYDLGIFEQAVRGYAEGHAPLVALKGGDYNILGDHFSPVLVTLAPLYWLWHSAKVLLLAQAALMALPVLPLSRWALRRVGPAAAVTVAFGYGASWGIASAVGFDFHEITFAVPLMAYAMVALGEQRWRSAVLWAAPLVLVKEDLGVTLAAVGAYVCWRGERRLGLLTVVGGIGASLLEMLVLLPAMSPSSSFAYWNTMGGGNDPGGHSLLSLPMDLISPPDKAQTLVLLLAPTLLLALRSPLLLIALPTLGWRMLSNNPNYWGTHYHYSAVLMPIVFAAFVEVLGRPRPEFGALSRRAVRLALPASVLVTLMVVPQFPLGQLGTADFWRPSTRAQAARTVLAQIPSGATVAASNRLVPQLTNRCRVLEFGWPEGWTAAEWIVVEEADPMGWPLTPERERQELAGAEQHGYAVVLEHGGVTLLRRQGPPAAVTPS